jgi:hypothetical protein
MDWADETLHRIRAAHTEAAPTQRPPFIAPYSQGRPGLDPLGAWIRGRARARLREVTGTFYRPNRTDLRPRGARMRAPDVHLHHHKHNPPDQTKRDADSHADATKGFPNLKVLRP